MSKNTKYPVDKIIQIIAEATIPGSNITSVCRKYNISYSTFQKWKGKYSGLNSSEGRRLKVLEEENNRLKKILAEKELEIQLLREYVKKNI